MSLIDVENAKQIRDPMDVLIKMEVPEEVNLTYSGYASSSKVADAVLDERGWPMRILADLQGNGFQLDGSCQLYDPTIIPSATNGKIGVRGNIGQRVSITVTGDTTINGLSIVASGTDAVHFNGQTAALSDGQVIIPVGASSITIEFDPLTSDTRAEVSTAMAGTSIQVTNDSIISCVVSLRSDLSIDNPTLPESEINIDIYNDVDISEVVASIPDDTPITYSAGYVGDMSQERSFYVSGQVTWADNILSIHAVDAVHFLDREIEPIITPYFYGASGVTTDIQSILLYVLNECGINIDLMTQLRWFPVYRASGLAYPNLILPRVNGRDVLAFANNVFKLDNLPTSYFLDNVTTFWILYVDAGIPSLTTIKPSAKWDVEESDCGETKQMVDKLISEISVEHTSLAKVSSYANSHGSVDWIKGSGGFVSMEEYYTHYELKILRDNNVWEFPIPAASNLRASCWPSDIMTETIRLNGITKRRTAFASPIFDGEGEQKHPDKYGGVVYSRVVPWGPASESSHFNTQEQAWADLVKRGVIEQSDTSCEVGIFGDSVSSLKETVVYKANRDGGAIEINEQLLGRTDFSDNTYYPKAELFPKMAYESLFNRSNITGSFTWKGDPRMQPRDVVNFHRLDGTVEEITLENITIHHEGGGTYAEITYRKGIC